MGNLPQAGQDFYGSTCVISGWGRTYGGGPLPNVLQEAPIDILSQADCQYYYGSIITGYHVCVMDYWGESRGSCNGDSLVPSPVRLEDSGTLPEPHPSVSSTAPLATQVFTLMYHTSEAGSDKTLDCKSCKAYSNYNK